MAAAEQPLPPILFDTWLQELRTEFEGLTPMNKARERERIGREIDRILEEASNFVTVNDAVVVDNTGRWVPKDTFRVAVNKIIGRGVRGTGHRNGVMFKPKRRFYGE